MIRQTLNIFAVTVALVAAAVVSAMILELQAVQAYLGITSGGSAGSVWLDLELAALAGLVVDGLRLLAAKWWHRSRQWQHDLQDVFRSSLA